MPETQNPPVPKDAPAPEPGFRRAPVTVILEPSGERVLMERPRTALRILHALGLRHTAVLIIRDQELLTPDREIRPGDEIRLRAVMSSG